MEDHIKMLEDRRDKFIANVRIPLLSGFITRTLAAHTASSSEALEEALIFVGEFIIAARNNTQSLHPWERIGYQYLIEFMEVEFISLFNKVHGIDLEEDDDRVIAAFDKALLTNLTAVFDTPSDTPSDTSDSFEAF